MNKKELALIWDPLFSARILWEDAIELEKAGIPHGYKKGIPQKRLKECNQALTIIEREIRNG